MHLTCMSLEVDMLSLDLLTGPKGQRFLSLFRTLTDRKSACIYTSTTFNEADVYT